MPRPPTTDHSDPAEQRVEAAARWLLGQPAYHAEAVIPRLRSLFGLSAAEAIEATRECERLRRGAT